MDSQVPESAPRLLILEDDPIIAELFGTLFSFEGYETEVAGTVADGVRSLEARPPNAVLLDLMMPNASGLEFCRYVREESRSPHVPIVVVSAKNTPQDIDKATDAGADAYLTKPVPNRQLVETVQRLVLNPPVPSDEHERSSLELDVRRAVVQVKLYLAEIRRARDQYENAASHAADADRLSPMQKQDLLRQAADEYRRMIKGNEAAAWEILVAILERLELRERAIARQSRHRPTDADGWAQASSRAGFVEQDCRQWSATDPQQVLGEYEFALSSGDHVYAYLIERAGPDALEDSGAWAQRETLLKAIFDANPPDPDALAELARYYDLLNPLRAQLGKVQPPEGVILVQPTSEPDAEADERHIEDLGNGHRGADTLPTASSNGFHVDEGFWRDGSTYEEPETQPVKSTSSGASRAA
jgi:DNA-binding response OmpR family regulator